MFFKSSRPEVFRRNDEKSRAESNVNRFPTEAMPHSMLMIFKKFDYTEGYVGTDTTAPRYISGQLRAEVDNVGRTSRKNLINQTGAKTIELPFPKQLQDSTSLNLNGFQRDPLAEFIVNNLNGYLNGDVGGGATLGSIPGAIQQAGADLASAISSSSGGGLSQAFGNFKTALSSAGVEDVAAVARYMMQSISPLIGNAGNSINLATGQVLNPKETLAFEGVQLRQHTFNWDLYPRSIADSFRLQRIIRMLKSSILPTTKDFAAGFERTFLQYPYVCDIYLVGVRPSDFVKYKPAMVSNMTVDYGAGGTVSMMRGGRPAGVNLSLSFQELAIETAHDYGEAMEGPMLGNEDITSNLVTGLNEYNNLQQQDARATNARNPQETGPT